ncbi:PAS domain S-box protein [Chryseosolibacter indicus]|uniref:histidine kinase n=1 Tax=Chryseosolibacter indicus TaxID=2782351 RepID=A0ABS5VVN6_9BACT|nr:PAS domain S-box protein [Chryseosolibacter indicus]MBT1705113.1 PAS domain S-box protein [Chryseosolibacter indicus]
MIPLVDKLKRLKKQYLLFGGTILLTIITSHLIIQYDLNEKNEDANLINLAGKQRMLSQRISKIVLYMELDMDKKGSIDRSKLDTLRNVTRVCEKVHSSLLKGSNEFGVTDRRSVKIDSLLTAINLPLYSIISACKQLYNNPDSATLYETIEVISQHEMQFLTLMEKTVSTYQFEAEEKLQNIKRVELLLAVASIVILFLEFFLLFLPMIHEVEDNSFKLVELNKELSATNEEFTATEEELRSNLEYVTELQGQIESRERQYREVIESATDMIYELDENGQFTFVNSMLERVSGYSKAELLQKKYWEIIHPEFVGQTVQFYKDQLKSKKEFSYLELLIISASGKQIWVGQNVRMFYNNDWVWRVSVIARNISDIKEAQIALLQSESKFRVLADNAPVGIYQTDDKGFCTYVNKVWAEIAGMNPEDAYGSGWGNAIYSEDKDAVFNAWAEYVNNGKPFDKEFRFLNPTLGIRWVNSKAVKVQIEGERTDFVGTMTDITELREAQHKLVESESLYRLISENSHDVIAILSLDNKCEYVSSGVRKMLGYEPEELVGKHFSSLVHPEDSSKLEGPKRIVGAAPKSNYAPHFRLRRKDGTYVWIESSSNLNYDSSGKVKSIQTVNRDITARKTAELELTRAKEKAEEATRAKSQFLSMMSHEIRTPMNAIIGLSNLLLQETPRHDQLENLKLLKFSGENLLTIINDILDFNKIEAGKIELENIDFNLKDLLTKTTQMLEHRASEKGIKLVLSFNEKLPHIFKGDPVRINQVITNLVGNAIKFTEHGYVELKVDGTEREPAKFDLHFNVKDTGIGIESEKLNIVFESFSQANSDTTRKFGGTGLGLSITKRLLNLMNSSIHVTSVPGFGSTFSFRLTLSRGEQTSSEKQSTQNKPVDFSNKGLRVLLVEDNKVNQVVALNFLKKWGLTADIANNGREAIEMIQSKQFCLVLMDLQMPEMDGYEATRSIRALDDIYFKEIPILALTASAMIDVKFKVLQTGMNDFITKPFQPEELQSKISRFLSASDIAVSAEKGRKINLEQYTEGDEEFKYELAGLIISNIVELDKSLEQSIKTNNADIYRTTCHKVKPTISMLRDQEFTEVIDALKDLINNSSLALLNQKKEIFSVLSKRIIQSLEEERA